MIGSLSNRKNLIFLNVLILIYPLLSFPAHAQEDPNATVVRELKSEKIKSSSFRGAKLYSNGDIKLKDGTLLKKDGKVQSPDGSITMPNGTLTHPNGKKYLPGGIVISKDGKKEDLCKSAECTKFRNNNFSHSNGVVTGVLRSSKPPIDSTGKIKSPLSK
jgi:hypothetical protein